MAEFHLDDDEMALVTSFTSNLPNEPVDHQDPVLKVRKLKATWAIEANQDILPDMELRRELVREMFLDDDKTWGITRTPEQLEKDLDLFFFGASHLYD